MRVTDPAVANDAPEPAGPAPGALEARDLTVMLSRRRLLGLGRTGRSAPRPSARNAASLGAAAGVVWAASQRAQAGDVSADVDPGALVSKLVRRLTYGLTQTELGLAQQLGYQGYLERHLNPASIDDSVLNGRLSTLTTLTQNYSTLVALSPSQIANELTEAVFLRATFSQRQFFERMVEFWTDHFNIDLNNEADRYLKTIDDREVVRPNALGSFPALLNASARSPAMLYYLDNYTSVAGNANENYARELMELHTMGAAGGYTQQDVEEVARCFTGWTITFAAGPQQGTFAYNNLTHDQGSKTVLGQFIPANGGMQDGMTVLNILAGHPSTASYIAGKLCRWLLGENPSPAIVRDVAATYTATNGDIKSMIRTALKPNYLADAPPRYKRPFHVFVGVIRALSANVTTTSTIRSNLTAAGHRPYLWATPDGYPDSLAHWVGLLLPRWNFAASSANASLSGVTYDLANFFAGATTADAMADRINQTIFAGELDPVDRSRIRDYLLPNPPNTSRQRDALGLALSSPSFQWY